MDRLTIGETLEGFGFYGTPIYDYDELVAYLTNIKNNVNFDMECDLETELTNVINDYLKRLLG